MKTVSFTNPYDAEQAEIDRRMQYAEMLRQQGMEAPQGGMAGRMYVGPSWTQGLAQMLKAYGGRKGVEQESEKSTALASERAQKLAEALKGGDPEAMMQNPDTMGYGIQLQGQRDTREFQSGQAAETRRHQENMAQQARIAQQQAQEQQRAFHAEQNRLNREAQAARYAQGQGAPDPYYQFLPGADGYLVGDARTGQIQPGMVNGQRAVPGTLDPILQGQLAGAKAGGRVEGAAAATAQLDLPSAEKTVARINTQIDELLKHPGMSSAVGVKGASSAFGLLPEPIAGTDAAGFTSRLKQIQGGAFLEARQLLKGGGAITDFESNKAETAFSRMSTATSEQEFNSAAADFKSAMNDGLEKLRGRAGQSPVAPVAAPTAPQGGLTPEEQAELEQLRQELSGGR